MSTADISKLINRELASLSDELLAYPNEADMWKLPAGLPNSGGNIALHLIGNLRFFIGTQFGATGFVRERDLEFSSKDVPRSEIIHNIEKTADEVTRALATLDPALLEKVFPVEVGGHKIQTGLFLQHLASHLAYHLGQVDYHRRIVTGNPVSVGTIPVPPLAMT